MKDLVQGCRPLLAFSRVSAMNLSSGHAPGSNFRRAAAIGRVRTSSARVSCPRPAILFLHARKADRDPISWLRWQREGCRTTFIQAEQGAGRNGDKLALCRGNYFQFIAPTNCFSIITFNSIKQSRSPPLSAMVIALFTKPMAWL